MCVCVPACWREQVDGGGGGGGGGCEAGLDSLSV